MYIVIYRYEAGIWLYTLHLNVSSGERSTGNLKCGLQKGGSNAGSANSSVSNLYMFIMNAISFMGHR